MDSGLLWTVVGSAAGVLALGLAAWQVRLQVIDRHERKTKTLSGGESLATGGLPVAAPFGRLPVVVRGRDVLLREMYDLVNRRSRATRKTWALVGMGGVGKSTAALLLAEIAQKHGWHVWWVTALNTMSLTGGVVEVLHQLDAPLSVIQAVSESAPTAPTRAWEFLNGRHSAGKHWILVLDNADNPDVLAAGSASPANYTGWLRPDPVGVLVVTSRVVDPRIWGSRISLRTLHPLEITAAAQILSDLAPGIADPTGTQVNELAKRLGGLPLALHLAGTYLSSPFTRWRTFAEYREALDSAGFPQALAEIDETSSDARDTVQRTWEISLEGLAADGRPQARPMLSLLSCYAPATPIPAALLELSNLDSLFSQIVGPSLHLGATRDDRRQVRDALSGLAMIGLIQIDGAVNASGSITIHPVVADVNRSQLLAGAESVRSAIGRSAIDLLNSFTRPLHLINAHDWPSWQQVTPHLVALLEWLAPYVDDLSVISLLQAANPASEALWRCGDLSAAESLARLCVTAAVRLGSDEPAALSARYELATTGAFLARYAQGEHVDDETDENAGVSVDPLSSAHWLVRYQESEKLLREILAGRQRILGPDHPDTLTTRYRLAWVLGLQGRLTDSEQMYRELLEDRRREFGEDDYATTSTRHRIGWVLVLQHRYAQAEEVFRQLLPDEQRVLGDEHPATLTTRHRLAWAVGLQGRFAEAEEMHASLLRDERRLLGDEHPDTLTTRQRLAYVIARQGRDGEAAKMFAELLPVQQRVLGVNHPDTLSTMHQLAQKPRRWHGCG
jgi:tetratricopeptide (TPR) repeat protein